MTRPVLVLFALCLLAIAGMLALFVFSALEMSLGAGLADVAGTLWGITTLVDLGAGLIFVAIFLLGNFTTLVYLAVRCTRHQSLEGVFLQPRLPRPSDLPR
jgi:hypothetical protein